MLFSRAARRREARGLNDVLNERRTLSNGTYVTPEASIQRVAVMGSANLIASTCSQLPIDLYRGDGSQKRSLPKTPLLLDPSGEGYGFEDWAWNVFFRALVQGNVVGTINERDRFGFPTIIQLHDLNTVGVRLDKDSGRWVWSINGVEVTDSARIWHFRAFPQEGHILGLSPVGLHMRTIGIGLRAESFGAQFFDDGAHPTGVFTSAAKLDPTQAATVKSRIMAVLRGSREPLILPNDIRYQAIQVSPEESQFLETQKYSAAECARIFGPGVAEMLGYETGATLTYQNVNERALHLLVFNINNWLRRFEAALSSPKITPRGQYVRFNREALLQSTTLTKYKAYELALKNKWMTVDEVRELEDMTPVPWGKKPVEDAPKALPAKGADDDEEEKVTE